MRTPYREPHPPIELTLLGVCCGRCRAILVAESDVARLSMIEAHAK